MASGDDISPEHRLRDLHPRFPAAESLEPVVYGEIFLPSNMFLQINSLFPSLSIYKYQLHYDPSLNALPSSTHQCLQLQH